MCCWFLHIFIIIIYDTLNTNYCKKPLAQPNTHIRAQVWSVQICHISLLKIWWSRILKPYGISKKLVDNCDNMYNASTYIAFLIFFLLFSFSLSFIITNFLISLLLTLQRNNKTTIVYTVKKREQKVISRFISPGGLPIASIIFETPESGCKENWCMIAYFLRFESATATLS